MTLAVVSLFWQANRHSEDFSSMYSEEWVEKLYHGFARNLTRRFEFILYTDRLRDYAAPVTQILLPEGEPNYGWCILPYRLGRPMILVGLDTVVTGNVDHLADYCLTAERFACPLDPYYPLQVCNGVALVPAGHERIGHEWAGANDMEWVRRYDPDVIDRLFPGQVVSYKGHVVPQGLGDARIVYFHGDSKPHQIQADWIDQHWRDDMARERTPYVQSVDGKKSEQLGGWRSRSDNAKRRTMRWDDPERMALREARAMAASLASGVSVSTMKPRAEVVEVEAEIEIETAEIGQEQDAPSTDDISAMKWADLVALYELTLGEKPGPRMKRAEVEAAIRSAGR